MQTICRVTPEAILRTGSEYLDVEGLDLIRRAYEFAQECDRSNDVRRYSGQPAITHYIAVGETLARWHMDAPTIAAGILHDVKEDFNIHSLQVRATFKDKVAAYVDGVTKLKKFELPEKADEDSAYFFKVFLAVAEDLRVAIIKIADRLHNLRTLKYLPDHKRVKNAIETRNIFIPLTSHLGMDYLRERMEDVSLKYEDPETYDRVWSYIKSVFHDENLFLKSTIAAIREDLNDLHVPARLKRMRYGVYTTSQLMLEQGLAFPRTGYIQITVLDEDSCYSALHAVHRKFRCVPGMFQDLTQYPGDNLKRMIETAVYDDHGRPFHVRIVTPEMELTNRLGVIPYLSARTDLEKQDFLQDRVIETRKLINEVRGKLGLKANTTGLDLIMQFMQKKVYVSLGNGNRIGLPAGAAVLDYAFAISPETGLHFKRAILNQIEVPPGACPSNCDQLTIETSPEQTVAPTWLLHSRIDDNRAVIIDALKQLPNDVATTLGKESLLSEVIARKLITLGTEAELESFLAPVSEFMGMPSVNSFYLTIGTGLFTIEEAIEAIKEQHRRNVMINAAELDHAIISHPVFGHEYHHQILSGSKTGKTSVMLCSHCTPVPGDIIEVMTSMRKCILHARNCKKVNRLFARSRLFNVEWNNIEGLTFPARIKVKAFPSDNLLASLTKAITNNGARRISHNARTLGDGMEMTELLIKVSSLSTINDICNEILTIPDVIIATRV